MVWDWGEDVENGIGGVGDCEGEDDTGDEDKDGESHGEIEGEWVGRCALKIGHDDDRNVSGVYVEYCSLSFFRPWSRRAESDCLLLLIRSVSWEIVFFACRLTGVRDADQVRGGWWEGGMGAGVDEGYDPIGYELLEEWGGSALKVDDVSIEPSDNRNDRGESERRLFGNDDAVDRWVIQKRRPNWAFHSTSSGRERLQSDGVYKNKAITLDYLRKSDPT